MGLTIKIGNLERYVGKIIILQEDLKKFNELPRTILQKDAQGYYIENNEKRIYFARGDKIKLMQAGRVYGPWKTIV